MIKNWIDQLKLKAKALKKEIKALYLAYQRNDVPWYAKAFILLIIGYALSPIDLIPDFIPILGYLDDLILLPLGITLAIKMLPPSVLKECRQQADEMTQNDISKNWTAGAIIILIWIVIIFLILKLFLKKWLHYGK